MVVCWPRVRIDEGLDVRVSSQELAGRAWSKKCSYFQGVTVFRLSKGRFTHVLSSEVWGNWMGMGGGKPATYGYMQSFVREEPRRILVAKREIRRSEPFKHGAPLSAFRVAKVATCVEHLPSGTKREVAVSGCAQVTAAMRGIE